MYTSLDCLIVAGRGLIPMLKKVLLPVFLLLMGAATVNAAAAEPRDILLVLDNSGSMKKNDPGFLTGAAVREFLDRFSAADRVALLVFDQTARLLVPLTPLDESARAEFLGRLEAVNHQGLLSDSPSAIERGIYELKTHARPDADKLMVFMTDGIVDTGNEAMDAEKSRWLKNDLAAEAARNGIRIFGIAFTENADFSLIQSLALRTGGEYFRVLSDADIESAFRRVVDNLSAAKGAFGEAPATAADAPGARIPILTIALLFAAVLVLIALAAWLAILWKRRAAGRAARASSLPRAFLADLGGITEKRSYELDDKLTVIGRLKGAEADDVNYVIIGEPTIGRRHAVIEFKKHCFWVVDQSSLNGTFVNDRRIEHATRLKHGDRLRFHRHEFEFLQLDMFETDRTLIGGAAIADLSPKAQADGAESAREPGGVETTSRATSGRR